MDKVYAFGLVAAITVVGGGAFVACSSSSDSGGGGTTDSGVHPNDTGSGGGDTGTVTDSGTATDSGSSDDSGTGEGGTDCGSDPTLHPTEAGVGPYCPGYATGGKTSGPCPAGQWCCEQKVGTPSTCAADSTGCAGAQYTWQCDGPTMCSGGTAVCCGNGLVEDRPGCTYKEFEPTAGSPATVCAASCSGTQVQVCETAADCPTGKTCTPAKAKGKQIGFCL